MEEDNERASRCAAVGVRKRPPIGQCHRGIDHTDRAYFPAASRGRRLGAAPACAADERGRAAAKGAGREPNHRPSAFQFYGWLSIRVRPGPSAHVGTACDRRWTAPHEDE